MVEKYIQVLKKAALSYEMNLGDWLGKTCIQYSKRIM